MESSSAQSTQGKIFINGILSTHDGGKSVEVVQDCLGLNEDRSLFVEFFEGTHAVAGAWMIEVVDYRSSGTAFFREVYIDNRKYYIPEKSIRLEER
jgi:hypothetical protein